MDTPPSLPRKHFSPFLLIALFLVLLAVAARTILGTEDEMVHEPWQRLTLAIAGILSGLMALLFSIVALFHRRRGWPLSIFVAPAGVGLAWLLVSELRQPLERVAAQVKQSTAEGVAEARRSLLLKKGALTTAALHPALVAWGEEAMVRPYQEHGHHDATWDDAALQFIRGTVLELTRSPARPGVEHLRILGAQILRTECDDPWVLFLVHRLGKEDPDHREVMEKAAAAIEQAGYPPFSKWLARADAVGAVRREDPSVAQALMPACLESLQAALSARPLTDEDYRVWCELFLNDVGTELLKQDGDSACRIVESVPGTQEWFRLWMRGRTGVEQAWLVRGTGWANTVSSSQWQRFGELLAPARDALEHSLELQPKQPEIAKALMTIEFGSAGLPELRRRFDTAIQVQFDYLPAYDSLRRGLLPRWFGSPEALLAFGRNCVATQRFDTGVPWEMVSAVQDIASDSKDDFAYYRHGAPWNDLQAVIDGYLAHGDPARRSYYLSQKAVLAQKCGAASVAADSLQKLNYQIDPQVRADWNLPVRWIERTVTLCGPACHPLAMAEKQEIEHPEQALVNFQAAQKVPQLPPMTTEYLTGRAVEMETLIALRGAPWRPLTPPQDFAGWKIGSGEWKVIAPSVLEMKTGDSGARLTRLEPIGDTWELRGEFEFVSEREARTEAALFCEPPDAQQEHGFHLRFWTSPNAWHGLSLAGDPRAQAYSKSTDFEHTTPFLVRMANHQLRVKTSDGQWLADQPLPEGAKIEAGSLLSLGAMTGNGRTVLFRNLEWRVPRQAE